jgi:hypothetical protein
MAPGLLYFGNYLFPLPVVVLTTTGAAVVMPVTAADKFNLGFITPPREMLFPVLVSRVTV